MMWASKNQGLTDEQKQEIKEAIETQADLFTSFLSKLWLELGLEDQIKEMNELIEREEDENVRHKSAHPKYMGRGKYDN
jgi:hypothetical protein